MRVIVSLILVSLIFQKVCSQTLKVVDSKGNPVPYFTAVSPNFKSVKIGDADGRIFFSESEKVLEKEWAIRHLAFEEKVIYLDSIENIEITVSLAEKLLELNQVDIQALSDNEITLRVKSELSGIAANLTFSNSFLIEQSEEYYFESYGLFIQSGLMDRTTKKHRFDSGRLTFLPQYSKISEKTVSRKSPYQSAVSTLTVFLNDFIFQILSSKLGSWKRLEKDCGRFECIQIDGLNAEVSVFPNGKLNSISLPPRVFKDQYGIVHEITGSLDFTSSQENSFYTKFSFDVHKDEKEVKVLLFFEGIPSLVNFPENYQNRSNQDSFFNALNSFSKTPDYHFDQEIFSRLRSTYFPKTDQLGERDNFVTRKNSYQYHEVMEKSDYSSVQYMKKNSDFVKELLEIFKSYGLGW